jgi:hypothetical protein
VQSTNIQSQKQLWSRWRPRAIRGDSRLAAAKADSSGIVGANPSQIVRKAAR